MFRFNSCISFGVCRVEEARACSIRWLDSVQLPFVCGVPCGPRASYRPLSTTPLTAQLRCTPPVAGPPVALWHLTVALAFPDRQKRGLEHSGRSKPHPAASPRLRRLPDLTSGPATCDLPSSPAKTAGTQQWTSAQAPPAYQQPGLPIRLPNPQLQTIKTPNSNVSTIPPPAADRPVDLPPLPLRRSPTASLATRRSTCLSSCPVVRRRLPPPLFPTLSPSLGPATLPSPTPTGDRPTALCCFSVATIEIASCQTLRLNTAPSLHLDIDANPRPSVCRLRSAPRPRSRDHSCVDARLGAPHPGLINSIRRPPSSLRSAGDASVNL